MRGTQFINGLELILETQHQSWRQGDNITGQVEIKKHREGADENELSLALALVDLKKLAKKDNSAFSFIEKQPLKNGPFQISLDINCAITESSTAPYLVFGDTNSPYSCGLLQLNVTAYAVLQEWLEIFAQFHRFQVKKLKNKKNKIDITFSVREGKEFQFVTALKALAWVEDGNLCLDFIVSLKSMSGPVGSSTIGSKEKKIKSRLNIKENSMGNRLNHSKILPLLNSLVAEIKDGGLFGGI